MKRIIASALATGALSLISAVWAAAQNVPPEDLRTVGLIVAQPEDSLQRVAAGTAFFVEVPSRVYQEDAFVYLITAKHSLLDSDGNPLPKLWLQLQDARGTTREYPLPDLSQWILDPNNPGADLAALPYAPNNTNYETIPLRRFLNASKQTTVQVSSQVGAEAYYVTALSSGARFVAVTRFGKVSVASPTRVQVPGAGLQYLCFLEGASAPDLSGAPVFLHTAEDTIFWGMLENRSGDGTGRQFSGLLGVVPAGYIGETIQAMALVQDQKPESPTGPKITPEGQSKTPPRTTRPPH